MTNLWSETSPVTRIQRGVKDLFALQTIAPSRHSADARCAAALTAPWILLSRPDAPHLTLHLTLVSRRD